MSSCSNMWPEMIVRVYLTSAVQTSVLMIWIMIHTCLLGHMKAALTVASVHCSLHTRDYSCQ